MIDTETKCYEPPQRLMRFLRWFCDDVFLEEVEGDLYELFQEEVDTYGLKKARRRFLMIAMRYIRPYFLGKKISQIHTNQARTMMIHNVKIAFRHLLRQKFYSFIKVSGLALGIAACLLIGLYIRNELSYDRHHQHHDRIYRIIHSLSIGDYVADLSWTATPMAQKLLDDFPEVEKAGRIRNIGRMLVKTPEQTNAVFENGFTFADQAILEILHLPFIHGDPANALIDPSHIVITKYMADKFFPNENPVGKQLILNNNPDGSYQITGVLAEPENNSIFDFQFILSMEGDRASKDDRWLGANYQTYFLLAEGVKAEFIEEKLASVVEHHILPPLRKSENIGFDENNGNYVRLSLQKLTDIHLYSTKLEFNPEEGDIRYLWLFGTIAIFILLVACINFINLSTAQSAIRAKEVGVRKVLGGIRRQLISQFLTESILVSLIAFGLALLLAEFSLSYFNQLIELELSIPWSELWFLPTVVCIAIGIAIIAGIYPSFYLSTFKPNNVLKGALSLQASSGKLRSGLVVFQFVTAIILIIGTLTIFQQMNYMVNKKLGFVPDRLISVHNTYTLGEQAKVFKEQLLDLPEVEKVSLSGFLPFPGAMRGGTFFWPGRKTTNLQGFEMQRWRVDEDYIPTLKMQLKEGRNFSSQFSTDTASVIINEKAARQLGFKDPVGKSLTTIIDFDNESNQPILATFTIIGLIEDFHFESLRSEIGGVCLFLSRDVGTATLKVSSANIPAFISKLEGIWDSFSPPQKFQYTFVDESISTMYKTENRTAKICSIFALLAIFIACLGLFSLAAFMVERRSKEISIRKVLGASIANIYQLLIQHFLKLVFIALLFAIPLGWILMQHWLQDFAYRIALGIDIFAVAGILAIIIAILTISYQAIKASLADPILALKNE